MSKSVKHYLEYSKLLYDPIHGYIGITEQEQKIIDTPIFQRLRHIKQLGTSFLVYPGATHSRFAHSLGTMYIMNKVAHRLYQIGYIDNLDEIRRLRLAALLHDLGHYPFSHCLEKPIQKSSPNGEGSHEAMSVHFIHNTSIKENLDTFNPEEISSIISKKEIDKPIYSHILSSDLDVDRIDYLIRDAHQTGVSYGLIDVERLIRTLTIDSQDHLAIEHKGRQALENFLLARYHMYQVVYYHKTVVGFDLIVQRAYEKLMTNGQAYSYADIVEMNEDDLCDFNDHYVWSLFAEHKKDGGFIGEIITRLRERKRLKKIKEVTGISIAGKNENAYTKLSLLESDYQLQGVSKQSNVPSEWIFYSAPKPLSVLSKADDETAIRIMKEDNSIPIVEDSSSIISSLYKSNFLSSRVYTKEEYQDSLLKGIHTCLNV